MSDEDLENELRIRPGATKDEILKCPKREATDERGERRKANCIIQEVTPSTEEENEMGMLGELAEGTFIDSYKIINKLGIGSQGSVYSVEKNGRIYALKIGHSPRAAKELEMETEVLKMATKKQLDHFCKYVDDGTYKKFYKYLAMSQVGKSLAQLLDGKEKFSNGCALIIAKQCFKALSNLHSMGYIHRDLMPSNFAIGLKEKENDGKDGRKNAMDEINNFHKIYLIDLGCCQNPHLTSEKEMNMLGNRNFCSMASHNNFELTYKDDMESLLYVILKFLGLFDGTSGVRNDILPIKQGIMENFKYSGDQVLPGTLPGIVGHIRSLKLGKNADVEYLMKSMDLVFEVGL
uniref:Protein kinase domain-containing protein n=1 Tax=Panagrolaimus davidi TaxID=227884 RepID=A0A914QYL7_9BILA